MAGANSPCRCPSLPRHRVPPGALIRMFELSLEGIKRLAKPRVALYRTTYRKI
jgi:hypothetical protein